MIIAIKIVMVMITVLFKGAKNVKKQRHKLNLF